MLHITILLGAGEAGSPLNPPPERRQGTPIDPLAHLLIHEYDCFTDLIRYT